MLALAVVSSCSTILEPEIEKTPNFRCDKATISKYESVLDSLNRKPYVPSFRWIKSLDSDFKSWNFNDDEAQFLIDSVSYYTAREAFFNQDKEFLYWLLSFKNDTIQNPSENAKTLWIPFLNPYSSTFTACHFGSTRSVQAISLIFSFLDGNSIECVSCSYSNPKCLTLKYAYLEGFLKKHRNASTAELRAYWKTEYVEFSEKWLDKLIYFIQ